MPSSSTVRRALQADHASLGDLWIAFMNEQAGFDDRLAVAHDARERWNNDFPVWLSDDRQATFVVEMDDALCGFVTAHQWTPPPIYEAEIEVYLDELYVVPSARRCGFGRQLVEAVRNWAASLGAVRIRLQALHANAAAQAFWAACGTDPFAVTHTVELDAAEQPAPESASRSIGFT